MTFIINKLYDLWFKFNINIYAINSEISPFLFKNIYRSFFYNRKGQKIYYVGILVRPENKNITCSGMSTINHFIAFKKAFSEYLELLFCTKNNVHQNETRSGMASHQLISMARENAYNELIERDSFIMHFLSLELKTKIIKQGPNFFTVQLQSIDKSIYVILSARLLKNNWILGLGANKILGVALSKSLQEVSMLSYFNTENLRKTAFHKNYNALSSPHTKNFIKSLLRKDLYKKIRPSLFSWEIYQRKCQIVKNKFVIKLESNNLLRFSIQELWDDSHADFKDIMSQRSLRLNNWNIPPFI